MTLKTLNLRLDGIFLTRSITVLSIPSQPLPQPLRHTTTSPTMATETPAAPAVVAESKVAPFEERDVAGEDLHLGQRRPAPSPHVHSTGLRLPQVAS